MVVSNISGQCASAVMIRVRWVWRNFFSSHLFSRKVLSLKLKEKVWLLLF